MTTFLRGKSEEGRRLSAAAWMAQLGEDEQFGELYVVRKESVSFTNGDSLDWSLLQTVVC